MLLPTLEAERIRLRPYRPDDCDAVFALFGDPAITRFWSFPAWTERAQADAFLTPLLKPLDDDATALPWAIADRETDVMLGQATIFALHRDQQRAEIGFAIVAAHWGRGLAREAVRRALVYGFDELGLRRVEADVDPRNASSLKLLAALGFAREGFLRERWRVAGETCDSVVLGLLARELR